MGEQLREIGLREGTSVIVHASLRAIGPMAQGAQTLFDALRETLGPSGTLLVPAFRDAHFDPAESRDFSGTPDEREREIEAARAAIPPFDPEKSPVSVQCGVFPEFVRRRPDAFQTHASPFGFAAVGANAEFLTANAPFHFPLGSDSPLARLHQVGGMILLIGVGQERNAALHLAEVWANAPYIQKSAAVKTGPEKWDILRGVPQCGAGFPRIQSVLNQGRIARHGSVGNAPAQRMPIRAAVSMAIAMLHGEATSLLCEKPDCDLCRSARKTCQKKIA